MNHFTVQKCTGEVLHYGQSQTVDFFFNFLLNF